MYFLRELRAHGVEEKFMLLFYHAVTESILRRGTAAWYGNLTVESKITDCPSGTDSYGDHGGQKPATPPSDNNLRAIGYWTGGKKIVSVKKITFFMENFIFLLLVEDDSCLLAARLLNTER